MVVDSYGPGDGYDVRHVWCCAVSHAVSHADAPKSYYE